MVSNLKVLDQVIFRHVTVFFDAVFSCAAVQSSAPECSRGFLALLLPLGPLMAFNQLCLPSSNTRSHSSSHAAQTDSDIFPGV